MGYKIGGMSMLRKSWMKNVFDGECCLLLQAIEGAGDGVWFCHIPSQEVFLSSRCFELIGYPCDETMQDVNTIRRFLHPEDQKPIGNFFADYIDSFSSESCKLDFRLRTVHGAWKWVSAQGRVVKCHENGEPLLLAGTVSDLTGRKEIEKELRAAKRSAEEARDSQVRYLASMSHEIRTPLVGILGATQLLSRRKMDAEENELLEIVETSCDILMTLVKGVLDLAKLEVGAIDLEKKEFRPCDLLSQVKALFSNAATEKGLTLSTRTDCTTEFSGCIFLGDAGRIRQVLVNLVSNAVKFTHEGGVELSVVCAKDERGQVKATFEVADTGIGIEKEALSRLFKEFVQADPSISRKYGGTGLGLMICKRMVEAMGGTITVESLHGEGSLFRFHVPLETSREMTCVEKSEPNIRALKILLAEDNRVNRKVTVRLLESCGHGVFAVENGLEAVEAVLNEQWDLIFMDVNMPVLNGLAATKKIRQLEPPKSSIPIIALSANAIETDVRQCIEAGMDSYITKPVSLETMMAEVVKIISRGNSIS